MAAQQPIAHEATKASHASTLADGRCRQRSRCDIVGEHSADVAELVDAHGSGPCRSNPVEVRVLSSASQLKPWKSADSQLLPRSGGRLRQWTYCCRLANPSLLTSLSVANGRTREALRDERAIRSRWLGGSLARWVGAQARQTLQGRGGSTSVRRSPRRGQSGQAQSGHRSPRIAGKRLSIPHRAGHPLAIRGAAQRWQADEQARLHQSSRSARGVQALR
jgi:hypothetical protein